jgi:hypothetical protein
MKDKLTLNLINFQRNTPNWIRLIENIYIRNKIRTRGPSVQVTGSHGQRRRLFRVRLTECQMNSVFGTATLNNQRSVVISILFIGIGGGGVQVSPLGISATNRPTVPVPGDYDDGEIGGVIGKGNRSTRRKPTPMPLCPPQTPHATQTRTRAAAVGSQRLAA